MIEAERIFETREALAETLARDVADELASAIEQDERVDIDLPQDSPLSPLTVDADTGEITGGAPEQGAPASGGATAHDDFIGAMDRAEQAA